MIERWTLWSAQQQARQRPSVHACGAEHARLTAQGRALALDTCRCALRKLVLGLCGHGVIAPYR